MEKFCVNCKHHKFENYYDYCYHPEFVKTIENIDMISGKWKSFQTDPRYCFIERNYTINNGTKCSNE